MRFTLPSLKSSVERLPLQSLFEKPKSCQKNPWQAWQNAETVPGSPSFHHWLLEAQSSLQPIPPVRPQKTCDLWKAQIMFTHDATLKPSWVKIPMFLATPSKLLGSRDHFGPFFCHCARNPSQDGILSKDGEIDWQVWCHLTRTMDTVLESNSCEIESFFAQSSSFSNPFLQLMAEILHQLIGSLSNYLQGFIHPRWCRISAINSRYLAGHLETFRMLRTLLRPQQGLLHH